MAFTRSCYDLLDRALPCPRFYVPRIRRGHETGHNTDFYSVVIVAPKSPSYSESRLVGRRGDESARAGHRSFACKRIYMYAQSCMRKRAATKSVQRDYFGSLSKRNVQQPRSRMLLFATWFLSLLATV